MLLGRGKRSSKILEINSKRNQNLDLLKILACIAVVGLHTLQKDVSQLNLLFYNMCGFAVPIFFVSSGYCLLNRDTISLNYVIRKVLNILRVVVIWNALVILSQYMLAVLHRQNINVSVIKVIKTIIKSLLQRGVLWQFWYFGALILVYLLLPLLNKLVKKGYALKLWVVLVSICILFQMVSYIIGTPVQENVIQTFRLWTWLQYFVLGSLMDKKQLKVRCISFKMHSILLCGCMLAVGVYQIVIGKYLLHNSYAEYYYDSIITIVWIILIFTWVIRLNLAEKSKRFINGLAPQIMGVYIVHPLLIRLASHFIEVNQSMGAFIYFIVVLSMSFILVYFINKTPLGKLLIIL